MILTYHGNAKYMLGVKEVEVVDKMYIPHNSREVRNLFGYIIVLDGKKICIGKKIVDNNKTWRVKSE